MGMAWVFAAAVFCSPLAVLVAISTIQDGALLEYAVATAHHPLTFAGLDLSFGFALGGAALAAQALATWLAVAALRLACRAHRTRAVLACFEPLLAAAHGEDRVRIAETLARALAEPRPGTPLPQAMPVRD